MDPNHSAQDILRCQMCESSLPPYQCECCHTYLCQRCAGEHHKVTLIQHLSSPTSNYPKCHTHDMQKCEVYCERCDLNLCAECISSGDHEQHEKILIFKRCDNIKKSLRRALTELEEVIHPKYQEAASSITVKKAEIIKNSQKLTERIRDQKEVWHNEIDIIIQDLQSEINRMQLENQSKLEKEERDINHRMSEISQTIHDLKELVDSNDLCLVSECKFSINEYKILPPKFNVTFLNFSPKNVDRKRLSEEFGSLSISSVAKEVIYQREPESPTDSLLENAQIITSIDTQYKGLYSVTCRNDDEIWTRGLNKIMSLYNFQGDLLESISTKSLNEPYDLTVSQSGELVYTDFRDGSINIIKNGQIEPVIRRIGLIWRWKPMNLCSTQAGDLLVSMASEDKTRSKIVRYSDYHEIQRIQYDNNDQPLFSAGTSSKCLCENKNLDICVADHAAEAVVVVTSSGKFRFRYKAEGKSHSPFAPSGITTDSRCRILTSYCFNQCIHILDQDGQFLRLIDNTDLGRPWGLCTDSNDNLIVGDWSTGKIKKIKYYK